MVEPGACPEWKHAVKGKRLYILIDGPTLSLLTIMRLLSTYLISSSSLYLRLNDDFWLREEFIHIGSSILLLPKVM